MIDEQDIYKSSYSKRRERMKITSLQQRSDNKRSKLAENITYTPVFIELSTMVDRGAD